MERLTEEEIKLNWKESSEPLVSICCITYNHENFIREAVEGFLMQKTIFPFEIIIHDDASTDKTSEILKEYKAQYPNIIKCFYQTENQYSKGARRIMARFTFPHARGKYTALCEGDDYWTDPLKLQKQVDYMSGHEDCNLVFTDVQLLEGTENKWYPNWASITKDTYEFKDLAERNVITTCTVLFRNPYQNNEIQNWLEHLINKNIEVLEAIEKLNLTKQELFYVKKSLLKWYYTKVVRMSSNLRFYEIRPYIIKHLKWSDVRYSQKYFMKTMVLFLYPKLKAGAFKKLEIIPSN